MEQPTFSRALRIRKKMTLPFQIQTWKLRHQRMMTNPTDINIIKSNDLIGCWELQAHQGTFASELSRIKFFNDGNCFIEEKLHNGITITCKFTWRYSESAKLLELNWASSVLQLRDVRRIFNVRFEGGILLEHQNGKISKLVKINNWEPSRVGTRLDVN
jgi:hypothetical protein